MMTVDYLVEAAHSMAKEKGWWDEPTKSPVECHALAMVELAEAIEECRVPANPHIYLKHDYAEDSIPKPQGEAIELADAIIRIADYFGHKGWDLEYAIRTKMKYNSTRPYRHGNKRY